jgi:hypothetical protein
VDPTLVLQRSIDLVVFGIMFVVCLLYLETNLSLEEFVHQDYFRRGISFLLQELDSMNSVYFFLMALILIYTFTYIFSFTSVIPISFGVARDVFWLLFLLCAINEGMKRAVHYSLFASLDEMLWNGSKDPSKKEKDEPSEPPSRGEVFHIGNQLYTSAEADEVCRLVNNSRLATREELEKASKKGADWQGSYGWCTNQEAYTVSAEKGVTGGHVKRGDFLLGVNCIGKKPSITDRDKALMDLIRAESKGLDVMSQMKLLFAELNPSAFMTVRPFNFDQWESTETTPSLGTEKITAETRLQQIEDELGVKQSK